MKSSVVTEDWRNAEKNCLGDVGPGTRRAVVVDGERIWIDKKVHRKTVFAQFAVCDLHETRQHKGKY